MIEVFLFGIILALIPITLAGLFVTSLFFLLTSYLLYSTFFNR